MATLVVDTKNEQNEDIKIVLHTPTASQLKDAQFISAGAFQEGVKKKLMLRETLVEYLREQGIWSDEKEQQLKDLNKQLSDGERRLARGGAEGFTKEQAKKLALDMRGWRMKQAELLAKTRELDEYTAQSFAENARFDYLVSVCAKYDDNRQVFSSLEDYKEKAEKPYAIAAATGLAKLIHNFNENWEKDLPENKFLLKYKFVNDKLRLVNKDGAFVDENGKLINEEGRYVNEKGDFVDISGRPVDAEGHALEEFVPFADDEPEIKPEPENVSDEEVVGLHAVG